MSTDMQFHGTLQMAVPQPFYSCCMLQSAMMSPGCRQLKPIAHISLQAREQWWCYAYTSSTSVLHSLQIWRQPHSPCSTQ